MVCKIDNCKKKTKSEVPLIVLETAFFTTLHYMMLLDGINNILRILPLFTNSSSWAKNICLDGNAREKRQFKRIVFGK